jgi:putative glutamine amidotransferase
VVVHNPLVAITTHVDLVADGVLASEHEVMGLPYVKAVVRAGGVPVGLPVTDLDDDALETVLDRFGAVVLTGGADVDPAGYGCTPAATCGPVDPARDARDIAVARACVARNQPMLAVCRGIQVLNVAVGGTLHQHVDGHMDAVGYNRAAHGLRIDPDSALAGVMGATDWANSLHHQHIAELGGAGAREVAWAPDGVIEAIELADAPNVLGVQWHPEMLRYDPAHLGLFRRLLELNGPRRG